MAKDKAWAKQQLEHWIKDAHNQERHDDVNQLFSILKRLQFNVNTRLQLEQLIYQAK